MNANLLYLSKSAVWESRRSAKGLILGELFMHRVLSGFEIGYKSRVGEEIGKKSGIKCKKIGTECRYKT
jgi:hypothetical protein